MRQLLCVGMGFSARALAERLSPQAWQIAGTARGPASAQRIIERGWQAIPFDGLSPSSELDVALGEATHLLLSAPPGVDGDPLLAAHAASVRAAPRLEWIGYLSTTGVYGDQDGRWIDETTPAVPRPGRGQRRLDAETAWRDLAASRGCRVQVFRISGIYGPGRSAIDQVRAGTARRIIKPGQVFNRIHVDDIAAVLEQAMAGRGRETIYNLADDEPAPPEDVIAYAATLLGMPLPPAVAFADAQMSDMARSFYGENKRVRNDRIKTDLGVVLRYPTYREGLASIARIAS